MTEPVRKRDLTKRRKFFRKKKKPVGAKRRFPVYLDLEMDGPGFVHAEIIFKDGSGCAEMLGHQVWGKHIYETTPAMISNLKRKGYSLEQIFGIDHIVLRINSARKKYKTTTKEVKRGRKTIETPRKTCKRIKRTKPLTNGHRESGDTYESIRQQDRKFTG